MRKERSSGFWVLGFLLLVMIIPFLPTTTVSGSETRTLSLNPISDSYVTPFKMNENFGKDTSCFCEFRREYNQVNAYSFTVAAGKIVSIPIYLYKGDEISGSFVVTSGGNRDVNFAIVSGTNENDIFSYAYRATNYSFSFVSPYTDVWLLKFDNAFSFWTSKSVSLSDVLCKSCNIYASPAFVQFDLSEIPPEATILESRLSFYVISLYESSTLGAYYCSNNDWKETEITYANAPLTDIKAESASYVSISEASKSYELDVIGDVIKGAVNGKLSEVIAVASGGMVEIASRESTKKTRTRDIL